MSLSDQIISKEESIAVVGLGYVGLPLAIALGKKARVTGFDISEPRIKMLKNNIDPSEELSADQLKASQVQYTSDPADLKKCAFIIVAVPTPIDSAKNPDLTPILAASRTVGQNLKKNAVVVFESTVYPGVTEDVCGPALEKYSGLKCGEDFKLGYSPERINPGDKEHTIEKILKIVAGQDEETLNDVARVYEMVVEPGVHRASSIKVAEAAKVIENTQRDLNIALMNELSIIFNRLGIDTKEVLEAAGTKWNFLKFSPGLVGGHCIGVDPYYLTHKAKETGYNPEVILAGRRINDSMGKSIADETIKKMVALESLVKNETVIMMGLTFKENVSDFRNTRVIDIIKQLQSYSLKVIVCDPYADPKQVKKVFGIDLVDIKNLPKVSTLVFATAHDKFIDLSPDDLLSFYKEGANPLLIDIRRIFDIKEIQKRGITYWGL